MRILLALLLRVGTEGAPEKVTCQVHLGKRERGEKRRLQGEAGRFHSRDDKELHWITSRR